MATAEEHALVTRQLIELLVEERKKQGMSMNALAARSGLSQSMVVRLENAPKNTTIDSLLRLANALQVNLGEQLAEALKRVAERPNPTKKIRPKAGGKTD